MNLEILFKIFNIAVLPFWALMIFAPRSKWTDRLVHALWMPCALALWLIALEFLRPSAPDGAGFGTLKAVMLLTGGPLGTLAMWTQLMGWDLFVGMWIARDARRLDIHHALVVICLTATFLIGPPGALLYFVLRAALRRAVTLIETASEAGKAA